MEMEYKFQWFAVGDSSVVNLHQTKSLDVLEQELADIQNSLEVIDAKRRMLANLSKLY